MATFNKVQAYAADLHHGKHNYSSDALYVFLSNQAPDPVTMAVKADVTEISAGNGYTTGGLQVTTVSSSQTGGVYKLVVNDVMWTASGGPVGPFRYAWLYNNTAAAKNLIGYHDYGSSITLASGEPFTWDASLATGILTFQ
jgi:hypothetical protein